MCVRACVVCARAFYYSYNVFSIVCIYEIVRDHDRTLKFLSCSPVQSFLATLAASVVAEPAMTSLEDVATSVSYTLASRPVEETQDADVELETLKRLASNIFVFLITVIIIYI